MTFLNSGPPDRPRRVVVGVDSTLSGLQAFRVAVTEARRRGAELHAVRGWGAKEADLAAGPPSPTALGPGGAAGVSEPSWEPDTQRGAMAIAAAAMVSQVFVDTMGGQPPDLAVRSVVRPAPPGPVLVEYAHRDDDLLVIGTGRRGLLRRLRGSPVVRYCLTRAACPVLVVPPPPLTRAGSPRALLRQLRREIDQLAEGGADR